MKAAGKYLYQLVLEEWRYGDEWVAQNVWLDTMPRYDGRILDTRTTVIGRFNTAKNAQRALGKKQHELFMGRDDER